MKLALVCTPHEEAQRVITETLRPTYRLVAASSRNQCLEGFRKVRHEHLFVDVEVLRAGEPDGSPEAWRRILQPFREAYPTSQIIVLARADRTRDAVYAVKAGAHNYLNYPIAREEIELVIEQYEEAFRRASELDYLRDQFWEADSLEIVQTRSPAMRKVFEKVRSVAPTRATVLLTGATGTGKGVIAQLIHRHSSRRSGHFISVHCGAIPDTLLESELFGHEKGSFTGAMQRKLGKFEIARGGTLFLDEIGTITPSAQIKLLQVLQERTFQRVGGEANIETDVRIISATNIDLKGLAEQKAFRYDLYYRLDVFSIEVPPLQERIQDVPHLVDIFLKRLRMQYPKPIEGIHPEVLQAFRSYPWPGNIRELENLVERAFILESGTILTPDSFPSDLFAGGGSSKAMVHVDADHTLAKIRRAGLETIERQYLRDLLDRNRGRINKSAECAGISTRQLHKLLSKYGIRKEDFKLERR